MSKTPPTKITVAGADPVNSTGNVAGAVALGARPSAGDDARRDDTTLAGPSQWPGPALAEVALVARAQDGDAVAFERLVQLHQAGLVRLGYRLLSDVGEAQDAAQDAFVLAWRKLPTLASPEAFRSWLYQLMTRRCLNLLRARTRSRINLAHDADLGDTGQDTLRADPAQEPAEQAQVNVLQDGLTRALASLPAELRACWVLHEMHDLSYPEIAYAMGVPVSTVRGRISRGRQLLAKGMTGWR
jgi:RNA polymerase sigma-70 factor (ECF subfamily)